LFSHYKVTSTSEMKEKIINFVCIVCGLELSPSSNIQVLTKDNNHKLWFMQESYGISVWITDFDDVNVDGSTVETSPYYATSTVGLAGRYVTDEQVTVIDEEATAEAKAEAMEELEEWKKEQGGEDPESTFKEVRKKVIYEQELAKKLKEIDEIKKTKKEWHRLYDTNVFHIGGVLRFSDVTQDATLGRYKYLDCHYNDGVFAFFLYSHGDRKNTNTLVIGEYTPTHKNNTDRTFILSNTFRIVSENKNAGYDDSFVFEGANGIETFPLHSEDRIIHYNNELFRLVQYDIDAEPEPKKYSVNGVKVGFRQNIAPVWIQKWNLAKEKSDSESKYNGNIKVLEWQYRELHCTYECEESTVGVNYFPLLDTQKRSYRQYDPYIPGPDPYDDFTGFRRSGTGGNSVNTNNNISECMPLIFYVLRDPDDLDSWSCVGMTDIVGYINMYNMSSGRVLQSRFRDNYQKHACYDLYKRRCKYTPWSPDENEPNPGHKYNMSWGFGGYPGIHFKLDDETTENALAIGRGRVV